MRSYTSENYKQYHRTNHCPNSFDSVRMLIFLVFLLISSTTISSSLSSIGSSNSSFDFPYHFIQSALGFVPSSSSQSSPNPSTGSSPTVDNSNDNGGGDSGSNNVASERGGDSGNTFGTFSGQSVGVNNTGAGGSGTGLGSGSSNNLVSGANNDNQWEMGNQNISHSAGIAGTSDGGGGADNGGGSNQGSGFGSGGQFGNTAEGNNNGFGSPEDNNNGGGTGGNNNGNSAGTGTNEQFGGNNNNGFGSGDNSGNGNGQGSSGSSQFSQTGPSNQATIGNGDNGNTNANNNGFLTFEDHNVGIRMQFPSDWSYTIDKATVYFQPGQPSPGAILSVRQVQIKDTASGGTTNLPLSDVAKVLINQFRGNDPSFNVQSVTPHDDTSIVIRMSYADNNGSERDEAAVILKINNQLILAMYTALPQTYSQFISPIVHMINSINLIGTSTDINTGSPSSSSSFSDNTGQHGSGDNQQQQTQQQSQPGTPPF